ncbi:MAG: type 4a pilus biogenesis protein PilO [Acidobacteria bacterium]|nr:type 4a pilus biogenesis protein PilO [Acidobacteriota bacterium]
MSGGKAFLITVVVALALAGAGLFFLWKPKYEENQANQAKLVSMQEEIKTLKPLEQKAADLDREIASLQQQLESMRKIVPDEKEADRFIRDVQDKAAEAGIVIRRYTSKPVSTREFFSELPFEVELDGRYYQVLNFFERVGRLERIVNITNVQMASPELGQQALKLKKKYSYGPEETVVATCQAVTFFTPEPKAQTAAPAQPGAPGQPGRPGPPPAGR